MVGLNQSVMNGWIWVPANVKRFALKFAQVTKRHVASLA